MLMAQCGQCVSFADGESPQESFRAWQGPQDTVIPRNFPPAACTKLLATVSPLDGPGGDMYSCPRHTSESPPMPTTLPLGLSATDGDADALLEWLSDSYRSAAFKACVPLMKGEPLALHTDPMLRQ